MCDFVHVCARVWARMRVKSHGLIVYTCNACLSVLIQLVYMHVKVHINQQCRVI